MATAPADRRPFGVTFLSILIIVGGIVDAIVGVITLFNVDDDAFLAGIEHTKSEIRTIAWVAIAFGVIAILVGLALYKGVNAARLIVGILAAVRLAVLIWVVAAYHEVHWHQVLWPTVIYALVAGYLFFDEDAKRYFAR
jgi:hypothetical protein